MPVQHIAPDHDRGHQSCGSPRPHPGCWHRAVLAQHNRGAAPAAPLLPCGMCCWPSPPQAGTGARGDSPHPPGNADVHLSPAKGSAPPASPPTPAPSPGGAPGEAGDEILYHKVKNITLAPRNFIKLKPLIFIRPRGALQRARVPETEEASQANGGLWNFPHLISVMNRKSCAADKN